MSTSKESALPNTSTNKQAAHNGPLRSPQENNIASQAVEHPLAASPATWRQDAQPIHGATHVLHTGFLRYTAGSDTNVLHTGTVLAPSRLAAQMAKSLLTQTAPLREAF